MKLHGKFSETHRLSFPGIKLGRVNRTLANVSFLEHALSIVRDKGRGGKSTGEHSWMKDKIQISCLPFGSGVPKHHKDFSSCERGASCLQWTVLGGVGVSREANICP